MIYPIYIYGSSVLREECAEVERGYPELEKLVSDMFDTMYASEGVGLAAPQIGKSLRLFVVDTSPFGQYDPTAADYKRVFINPRITEESDEEVLLNEGCLSLPGLHEDVYRPPSGISTSISTNTRRRSKGGRPVPCSTSTTISKGWSLPTVWRRCGRRSSAIN